MQGLLQLLFCLVLLAKGSCLQCETCENNSTSCNGSMVNCTEEETCLTVITKTRLGKVAQHNIMKSCGNPTVCDKPLLYFDLGNGHTYRSKHFCCQEKDCSKITPTLPPLEKDPKGSYCPGCNKMGKPCKKETVQCTGKNPECFTAIMNITSNGKHVLHIMKGCSSKNVRDMFQKGENSVVESSEAKGQIKCTLSAATSSASQILASFLTTFYSFWILKLLV